MICTPRVWAASRTGASSKTERSSMSTSAACGRNFSKSSHRFFAGKSLAAPPSRGSRTVTISGSGSSGAALRSISGFRANPSTRSSKKSTPSSARRSRAAARAVGECTVATIFAPSSHFNIAVAFLRNFMMLLGAEGRLFAALQIPPSMSGRKQELNLQFQEIVDGTLLVLAFWFAHVLRFYATNWFSLEKPIAEFSEFRWVLWLLMPLGPLILEAQGFYKYILGKTVGKSLWQLLRAAGVLAVLLAVCWFFLRLDVPSRAVLILFAVLA